MRWLAGQGIRPRLLRIFLPLIFSLVLLQSFTTEILSNSVLINHAFSLLLITLVFLIFNRSGDLWATGWVTTSLRRAEKERVRAETALRISEERFRLLYEQAPLDIGDGCAGAPA